IFWDCRASLRSRRLAWPFALRAGRRATPRPQPPPDNSFDDNTVHPGDLPPMRASHLNGAGGMRKVGLAALGAAIAIGAFAAPGYASTVTDNFTFSDLSNVLLANGSFSYDSSKTGVIGYADLSAFTIQMH